MNHYYLDTSIFVENNFLEGKKIKQFFELSAGGHIEILLPQITYEEVIKKAYGFISDAVEKYNRALRVIKNTEMLLPTHADISADEALKKFKKVFDKRIEDCKIKKLGYPSENIKPVFEKYFSQEYPFGQKNKKNEFPDAFALFSIEDWCKKTGNTCVVFSLDKDILNYKSEYLIIEQDYTAILNAETTIVEIEEHQKRRLKLVKKLYKLKKENIESKTKDWFLNQLSNPKIYWKHARRNEVYNHEVMKCDVDLLEYQVISTTSNEIDIEATASIDYVVKLERDDESTGWLDLDNRSMVYDDREFITISGGIEVPVSLKIVIPLVSEDLATLEVEEVNYGFILELE